MIPQREAQAATAPEIPSEHHPEMETPHPGRRGELFRKYGLKGAAPNVYQTITRHVKP